MSVISNNQLAGAAGQGGDAGYKIDRSLRFNSGDSAYLNRTPSSAGNRKTFTWSGWVKRVTIPDAAEFIIFGAGTGGMNLCSLSFETDDNLRAMSYNGSYVYQKVTNAVFRDPSAWYHIVYAVDTTDSTAEDRVKLYVNGERITSFSTNTNPSQNAEVAHINSTSTHYVNKYITSASYGNLYLAEVYFIDGQQLAASDFGEYDDNNVWQPKEFTGSYTSTNTSTTLSQVGWNPSTTAAGNHTLIWDGTTTNKAYGYAGNSIGTVTFSPPLTGVTKVECYTQDYNHYLNGSSISTPETVNGGWHTYYDNSSTPITLNSLGNAYSNNTQTVDLAAIRINGTIIDSSTWTPPSGVGVQSSGGNSFYLKFADNSNNAALGTDSSGNSNTWTVNNLSAQTTSATNVNYDSSWTVTTNNGGVGTASISGNVATAVSGKWSGASSASALSTNSVSTAGFTTGSAGNTFFGLGKKLTGNYNQTIRDSSQSYGLYTGWTGSNTNNPGGHGSSITATGFSNGDLIKFEVDPGNSTLKTYKNGTLQATDTLSSSFVSAIQNGDIYWQSDQYSTGSITLTNGEPDATSDSLIDTPTNYTAGSGNNGGNYATFNPLDSHSQWTLSNGNLEITKSSSGGDRGCFLTLGPTSGKFYWEVTFTTLANENYIGLAKKGRVGVTTDIYSGGTDAYMYRNNGNKHGQGNGSGGASYGASWAANDVIGVAVDWDAGSITFYKNGSTQGAAWTGQDFSEYMPAVYANTNQSPAAVLNTGARPFAHTPPSGYKSLCTQNLADPTIADGSTAMDTTLYSGNDAQRNITGLGFSPDLVWIKKRSGSGNHSLMDTVRGATKNLVPNDTQSEGTETGYLNAFLSNGFSIGTSGVVNDGSSTYAAWAWDAGTVTNPVGDVWSGGATKYIGIKFPSASGGTVSYGQTSGSDTVEVWTSSDNSSWTQQGSTQTLSTGHTLTTSDQYVYIRNSSDATFTNWYAAATNGADGHYSGSTYPSGASWSGPGYTDYDFRDAGGVLNKDGSILSIVHANQSAGFSICTYTGNGTANSTVGHGLNASPSLIIIKNRDQSPRSWMVLHTSAGLTGTTLDGSAEYKMLKLESTNAAADLTNDNIWNPTSTAFKINGAGTGNSVNYSGDDYIAYCWAPVDQYSSFGSYQGNGSSDGPFVYTGFRPKYLMWKRLDASENWMVLDSERSTINQMDDFLCPNTNAAEVADAHAYMDFLSNGFKIRTNYGQTNAGTSATYVYAAFGDTLKTARAR